MSYAADSFMLEENAVERIKLEDLFNEANENKRIPKLIFFS